MASPLPPRGADGDSGIEGATHEAGGRDSGGTPLPAHQLLDEEKLAWDASGAPLGRGSFGTVYRAEYAFVVVGTRPVALKVLHGVDPDEGLKELCVVAGLENPGTGASSPPTPGSGKGGESPPPPGTGKGGTGAQSTRVAPRCA